MEPHAAAGRRRYVFSSSGDQFRASGSKVVARQMASSLVSSMSGIAECVFATLFPSDCRLCGAPLVKISRLPVCDDCVAQMRPIGDSVCPVCGERLVSPLALAAGEGCGSCRRAEPRFAKAVAYGSYDGR